MDSVLVTGASGYVGRSLLSRLAKSRDRVFCTVFRNAVPAGATSVPLDLRDRKAVERAVGRIRPTLVFHLACDHRDLRGSVIRGTTNLLDAAARSGTLRRFLLLSTDAVFDGEKAPYRESDTPWPMNEYGRAKRRAEIETLGAGGIVVRTSLVYGFHPPDGRTAALLRGLASGSFEHPYFTDEVRCPIFVGDLCRLLSEIARYDGKPPPIIHAAGPERLSRHDFATRLAARLGFAGVTVPSASRSESGLSRPRDVSLDTGLARSVFATAIGSVEEAAAVPGGFKESMR